MQRSVPDCQAMAAQLLQRNYCDTRSEVLQYNVVKWSSYSLTYNPANVKDDFPNDQTSRWSSETNTPPQYLLLELDKISILSTITFGKFKKTHVCNLRKFKVYAGLTENNLVEVIDGGLQNNHIPETFHAHNTNESHLLPVKFVKIEPLQSWGTSFNFSIWYVKLGGLTNNAVVDPNLALYTKMRERQAVRVCLKHFRQQDYTEAFEALRKKTKVALEDPLLEQLHQALVRNGDYETVEEIIKSSIEDDLFQPFINKQDLEMKWSKIEPINRDGSDQRPSERGGHQMVVDPYTETLYLFGGWDGQKDLADFWSYHVPSQQWTLISSNTERDGGPSARSCHKMAVDYERKCLFVLGRYLDSSNRNEETLKSSFYVYDIGQNRWTLITEETYSMGGPPLLFDHQMCMDIQRQTIYVFGGKVQSSVDATDLSSCSGLYSYHVPTNHWRRLRSDGPEMRSRYGHSMMLNQNTRKLYVFAGQRGKEFLNDLIMYDIDSDRVQTLYTHQAEPPSGFTQRATIDMEIGFMHLLLSMNRQVKDKDKQSFRNVMWTFDLSTHSWAKLPNDDCRPDKISVEPMPRFAHQFVYDHVKKVHYMFGGNPGLHHNSLRLDDFWTLSLCKPSKDRIIRQLKSLIRKHKFKELVIEDAVKALTYLQTEVFEVINHDCRKETVEFQKLASSLFDDQPLSDQANVDNRGVHHSHRSQLFDTLVHWYPATMAQPKDNLLDMIK